MNTKRVFTFLLGYGCLGKKKKRPPKKYMKDDGFGDMHSQTSLYSRDEEITILPKEQKEGTLKKKV